MSSWEIETGRYLPSIVASLESLSEVEQLTQSLPRAPFDFEPELEQSLAYQLMLFGRSAFLVVDQLLDNTELLWSQGRMIGVSHLIRSALEYRAAAHFGLKIISDFSNDLNSDVFSENCARLVSGSKTPVRLPWGDISSVEAFSVIKFIKILEEVEPGVFHDYNLLSEAAHPNFFQNFYFLMASRTYDNFSNEIFKKHAHEIMGQYVESIDRLVSGLKKDLPLIFSLGLKIFNKSD